MARARKVCAHPGCPNFEPCEQHARKAWAGSTRRQRLPRGWDKIRRSILRRDPICQVCLNALSVEVDHIQPGDNHHPDNLQGICKRCHTRKTQDEAAAARRA